MQSANEFPVKSAPSSFTPTENAFEFSNGVSLWAKSEFSMEAIDGGIGRDS